MDSNRVVADSGGGYVVEDLSPSQSSQLSSNESSKGYDHEPFITDTCPIFSSSMAKRSRLIHSGSLSFVDSIEEDDNELNEARMVSGEVMEVDILSQMMVYSPRMAAGAAGAVSNERDGANMSLKGAESNNNIARRQSMQVCAGGNRTAAFQSSLDGSVQNSSSKHRKNTFNSSNSSSLDDSAHSNDTDYGNKCGKCQNHEIDVLKKGKSCREFCRYSSSI